MPDVRGKKVLVFGDSLSSGQFAPGQVMANHLTGAAAVRVNAKVGRSAYNFFSTREDYKTILADIASYDPDLVLVMLGTNDMGLTMSVDAQKMAALRDSFRAGGAEVWAIGPPTFPSSGSGSGHDDDAARVVTMMHTVFGADHFIDMRPLTRDMVPAGKNGRASDGIHFSAAGGAVLGQRLADKVIATQDAAGTAALAVVAVMAFLWWWFR